LLRRACFDLTGLPPTPAEVEAFLADAAPDAYERLIDRLLDSPRYGERWGRHWLDIAGYADSDGYSDADPPRGYAYKYRDYVIRSFNPTNRSTSSSPNNLPGMNSRARLRAIHRPRSPTLRSASVSSPPASSAWV